MSIEEAELKKRILSHIQANETLSKDFSKLAKSTSFIDNDRVKSIYDETFYDIPKGGKTSHEYIVKESYDHINQDRNLVLDKQIKELSKEAYTKESELTYLENPLVEEHPVYENKALLVAGENGQQYQDMDTLYVMHEGRKRAFASKFVANQTKKALGLSLDPLLDGRYYLTLEDLNSIPDGPPIATTADLHTEGNALKVDLPDVIGISAYVDINFECLGNEVSDYVGALTDNMLDLNVNTLQFYLNNDACIIKYIKDDYLNDPEGPTLLTASIPKGETQTLRILRPTDMLNNMIPGNIGSNDASYGYANNIPTDIVYNGNDIPGYIKNWGPYGDYPSIVFAEGRIMSQEIENEHIGSALFKMGEYQDTTSKLFNGLPTSTTGVWGDSGIQLIADPNYTGQEKSDWGTKMIYNTPGQYGALGQEDDLQKEVFDDPSSKYYDPALYGQPIIRYLSRYLVVNKTYKDWGKRIAFWDAHSGTNKDKSRGNVEDSIGLAMDLSGNDILGLRWDTLKKDRIKYIGLMEYKTREQNVDDNIFNPSPDGSNYEINMYNKI